MSSRLKVSVVQTCPPLTPTSASPSASGSGSSPSAEDVLRLTLQKLDELTAQVAAAGSGFAVFPEAFIGGYPKFSTFGASIGTRTDAGRDEYLRYWAGAIALPPVSALPFNPPSTPSPYGADPYPALTHILHTAHTHAVFLVLGVIERAGGTLYCTLLSVSPEHGLVGKRRKLVPTASERVVWGMGQAEGLRVVEAELRGLEGGGEGGGRQSVRATVSAAVCWENYMPLLRTHFYAQNTQLYCAPTVDARPVWQHTMAHIALEGRCFVLSACQYSTRANYAAAHPYPPQTSPGDAGVGDGGPDDVVIAGGSVIISPSGAVLAGPLWGAEGVLTAEIDLEDCVRGKMDLDVTGHYARPDIFQLTVNARS